MTNQMPMPVLALEQAKLEHVGRVIRDWLQTYVETFQEAIGEGDIEQKFRHVSLYLDELKELSVA